MVGVELEVWAASVVGVGTELQVQPVGAAWVAAWVMEPGVSLQGALQEEDLRERDPEAGQMVLPGRWAHVVELQGGCLGLAEGPRDALLGWV